jgi:hypothetical protein
MLGRRAALVATGILLVLICFQILLAAGLPLGKAAWGGEHRVLPTSLRIGSLVAVGILAVAGWIVLARAGRVAPGPRRLIVRIGTWLFAGYFVLNTFMNLLSQSSLERMIMTPTAALLAICFIIVARTGQAGERTSS